MEESKKQLQRNSPAYSILSLFSGGGFLDLGFINQGFQIEEAVEIEPNFITSYNAGLSSYFKLSKNKFITADLVSDHR